MPFYLVEFKPSQSPVPSIRPIFRPLIHSFLVVTILLIELGGAQLARSNFQFNKRQKELARKKKKELKRQRKLEKNNSNPEENSGQSEAEGEVI
jgi:hypothetical protein